MFWDWLCFHLSDPPFTQELQKVVMLEFKYVKEKLETVSLKKNWQYAGIAKGYIRLSGLSSELRGKKWLFILHLVV